MCQPRLPQTSVRNLIRIRLFRLTNSGNDLRSGKFVISFSYLEQVDLFELMPDGKLHVSSTGSATLVSGNAIAAAFPTFQVLLLPGETREYYIRIRSKSVLFFPMQIVSESQFSRMTGRNTLLWSLIAGTALAFSLYAASMSFSANRYAYRAYLCFGLAAAAYILISSGLIRVLIDFESPVNLNTLLYAAQALVIGSATFFIIRYLDLAHTAPRLYSLFLLIIGSGALTGVSFLMPAWIGRASYLLATGFGPLILMLGLVWLSVRHVTGARALLIAWTPCFLATIWMYLRLFNLTPYLPINHFIVSLSFAFTLTHIAFIIGGRARDAELWAHKDALTGLANRRLLAALMDREARIPSRRYRAAIAIDLDNFKPVNDGFGHAAGDAVLAAVGERLRAVFKDKGDIFRLGGDEFLVLCHSSLSRMEVINLAADYLAANREPVAFEGHALSIDASIGVAFLEDHGSIATMLKQADTELYAVKQAGRGRIRIAEERVQDRRKVIQNARFFSAAPPSARSASTLDRAALREPASARNTKA